MKCGTFVAALSLLVLAASGRAQADDRTYYEKDGVTYCETRRVMRRPVTETRLEEREKTVYCERSHVEYQETYRTSYVPVTEYRWEAHWRNRYNPFAQPYLEQRLVPHTRLEPRSEMVRVPVTRRELVPEVRREQVPVLTQRFVEEEVISRVAVGPAAGSTTPVGTIARGNQIGGVAQLDNDPPRYISDSPWRASSGTIRR